MSDADDELLLRLDRESQQRTKRVRQMLIAEGREDLVAELDRRLKDVRTGVDGARSTWRALSGKQRWVLQRMAGGRYLARSIIKPTTYHAYVNGTDVENPRDILRNVCRLPTLRNLSARELIHVAGGALDPEAKFVITERGRFVFRYGPVPE